MEDKLEFLTNRLNSIYNSTDITPDGRVFEKRYRVANVKNLKIIIHPNEHPPAHFHVVSDDMNASFDVLTCEWLKGEIKGHDIKKIQYWHSMHKGLLIRTWNETRPSDCPVGKIKLD